MLTKLDDELFIDLDAITLLCPAEDDEWVVVVSGHKLYANNATGAALAEKLSSVGKQALIQRNPSE